MSWEQAIDFVLDYEGRVYENHPDDTGGPTKFGISQKAYPNLDIASLTEAQAKEIYRRDYWDRIKGDLLPTPIAAALLDCAVNQGVPTAIKLFQSMMDLVVDGDFGPKTIRAAQTTTNWDVHMFQLHRARQYMKTNGVKIWADNWGYRLMKFQRVFLPR